MEDTAVGRQIKKIKTQLRKDAEVMLKRELYLNTLAPEPKTRKELVRSVHVYVMEQFFRRCANRGVSAITYCDEMMDELLEKYETLELDHVPGMVVSGGKL